MTKGSQLSEWEIYTCKMEDKITKMIVLCDFSKKDVFQISTMIMKSLISEKMINVIHKINHELSHKMKIYLQFAVKRKYT